MIRLFADANLFVAAVASSHGGSALIMEISRKGLLEIVTSRLALLEAERNVRKKLSPSDLKRYHALLEKLPLLIVPGPTEEEIRSCQGLIHEKDAPILAAAMTSRVHYLLTLVQRHFKTDRLRRERLPFKIVTPKEFFQQAPLAF